MYRYFLAHDDHMPKPDDNCGHWHAIHLGSHGKAGKGWNALVLHDAHVEPRPEWQQFPKVVDHRTPISAMVDHRLLADVGVDPTHTALEAADVLARIFLPFAHP